MVAETSPKPSITLHDVTLEQYAGITVALDDAFPLTAVLANEGLDASAWSKAEIGWKQRLATDGPEGKLFTQFRAKRSEAEDWFRRRITPLDGDLGAWLSFLHAWSSHPAPFEMLKDAGLRMNDLSRLQRHWARRMEEDPPLKKRAAEIAQKGPRALPAIKAEVSALTPFPWSKGLVKLHFEHHRRRLQAPAEPRKASVDSEGASNPYPIELPAFVPMPAPPTAVVVPEVVPPPGLLPRPHAELAGTLDVVDLPQGPALPFEKPQQPRAELAGTLDVVELPQGPALPFVKPVLANEPQPPKRPSPLAKTELATELPRDPARLLPEKRRRPRSPLAETSLNVDIPDGPALPFLAKSAPPPASASLQPKVPEALTGTSSTVEMPPRPALPFAKATAERLVERWGAQGQGSPGAASPSGSSRTPMPMLTLEQHASLSVELLALPEQSAEAFARYGLTPLMKQQIDRDFQARFSREPKLRAAWDRAFHTYREWFIKQVLRK